MIQLTHIIIMKSISKILSFSLLVFVFPILTLTTHAQGTMVSDSIVMSNLYANEVYYNLDGGEIQTSLRNQWDIAFRTKKMSSSILTNDGAGVVLYTYPKSDTTGWAAMDTTGLSTWKPMYNDPTDWENGAFSRNAKGHPDYGWGKYNESTHDLVGDSLFVVKVRDGSFKKLWIVRKHSSLDTYYFRYANLDGSDDQYVSCNFDGLTDKDFIGYSFATNLLVTFEPASAYWDIVFTKYMSVQPNGTPYPVVGVLSNWGVTTKKFHPVPLSYDDFGAGSWDSTRSAIGWDWKVFDNNTFSYKIVDSTVYFIKALSGDIYKLYFTFFAGSSSGVVKFERMKAAGAGITEPKSNNIQVTIFPNPASCRINLYLTGTAGKELTFTLTDLSGRQLRADRPERMAYGPYAYSMDVTGVQPGVYFVTVSNAATKTVTKVIITH
jgi:predicted lipoprotein with Yx(FWY)xxD motif